MTLKFKDVKERNTAVRIFNCICKSYIAQCNLYQKGGCKKFAKECNDKAVVSDGISRKLQWHEDFSKYDCKTALDMLDRLPSNMYVHDPKGRLCDLIEIFQDALNSDPLSHSPIQGDGSNGDMP